ncbi:hypothetical protein ACS0TY_021486 [Phlomoides rotata]
MNKNKPSQACDPSQVSNVNEFCTLYCDGDSPPNLCNRVVRLRVLSLARCRLQGVPHEMDRLIHLIWLDLSENKLSTKDLKFIVQLYFFLEEIPNEIVNLCHLRHLNLTTNGLKELPSKIENLQQLRHLYLCANNDLKELPSEIGKLSFLQTFILPGSETYWGRGGEREKMKNEEQARSLFGISLTDMPRWQQFLICSAGFFFGYLVNGVCEEYVYNRLQFSYGWYFTFVQGWVYVLLIYLQGFTPKKMVNPWKSYWKLSAVLMGSNGLTKGSLAFLNYPAQIMFKSTKVLHYQ